jgi:hypothetical protein
MKIKNLKIGTQLMLGFAAMLISSPAKSLIREKS